MLRKIVSASLAVSLAALASSGVLMLALHGSEAQHLLHPVHIVFGVVMIAAGIIHFALNIRPFMAYMKMRPVQIACLAMTGLMLLLYAAGMGRHDDRPAPGFEETRAGTAETR